MSDATSVVQSRERGGLTGNSGVRRTLIAYTASALGVVPLVTMFSDRGWLLDVWLAMAVVLMPALLLRIRHAPGALQIWAGLVLLIPWVTVRYFPDHAVLGFLPGPGAWRDVRALFTDLHRTTSTQVAPVHSSVATNLALCVMLGLLVALVDLVAVVGRRSAVAAVPLLIVYTVAGAVARHAVPWPLFVIAAAGFLMLLAIDAQDDVANWGHRVRRAQTSRTRTRLAVSGQRIAVWSIVLAVALSIMLPNRGTNVFAQLLRHVGGSGGGSGTIDPFAALKGDLVRKSPVNLATVTVPTGLAAQPFYLRESVLSVFEGDGWVPGDVGATEPLDRLSTGQLLAVDALGFNATIKVTGLTGAPPVFAVSTGVRGLGPGTRWSPRDQVLLGTTLHSGQQYSISAEQVQPTVGQLQHASTSDNGPGGAWLQLPAVPHQVTTLVEQLTAHAQTSYDKARAISNFFADPANGFGYSLQTRAGDSGSDLVDFLTNRVGYCQQYAAALAVMLRVAGVPARVVLGYTHAKPDAHGNFVVTSNDAHAWDEAYFGGIGWVPFDPTPLAGINGGASNDLVWAPHQVPSTGAPSSAEPTVRPEHSASTTAGSPTAGSVPTQASAEDGLTTQEIWLVAIVLLIAVVVAIASVPWLIRSRRRRRRLRAARRDGPDQLWAELSDTATDLGYVWSSTRTPRQVAAWLAGPAVPAVQSLQTLALAVERSRYAPPATGDPVDLSADLAAVDTALRARLDRRTRIATRIWPTSVRWTRWSGRRTRRH
ncbi:MAG: DUF3488 and transglutaminase-like domain-containing protein [Jatrophihabitantaceae bacterium]